jgi:hypothetical protein
LGGLLSAKHENISCLIVNVGTGDCIGIRCVTTHVSSDVAVSSADTSSGGEELEIVTSTTVNQDGYVSGGFGSYELINNGDDKSTVAFFYIASRISSSTDRDDQFVLLFL